ncbi:hypothetical protein [Paludibaculum fermentans]|uniref:hypothetical protein n=1 Tax=Paludibaculum fermentans TaxID=1473598 RepID=UPI003EBDC7F0
MNWKRAFGLVGISLLLALGALAAEAVIGQAISQGSMDVDHALAAGVAPLSSGSVVKTAEAPGRIVLQNGVRGSLGPTSLAEIFADRMVLQSGQAAISSGAGYRVQAAGYSVTPAAGAQAKVEIRQGLVAVGATNGIVSVANREGILLARINPGTALSFEPAPPTESLSKVTGKLEQRGNQFFLTDELTHVQVELVGKGLAAQAGHRIRVAGTPKTSGDHPVLDVTEAIREEGAAGSSTTAKAASGVSHGTKIGLAVVGGAVAAAGVSLGAISR